MSLQVASLKAPFERVSKTERYWLPFGRRLVKRWRMELILFEYSLWTPVMNATSEPPVNWSRNSLQSASLGASAPWIVWKSIWKLHFELITGSICNLQIVLATAPSERNPFKGCKRTMLDWCSLNSFPSANCSANCSANAGSGHRLFV